MTRLFPPPMGLLALLWWTIFSSVRRRPDLDRGWRGRMWHATVWTIKNHVERGERFDTLADYRRIWKVRKQMQREFDHYRREGAPMTQPEPKYRRGRDGSLIDIDPELEREQWRATWRTALVGAVCGAVGSGVVMLIAWLIGRS